jgi:hypothetical protein
LFYKFEKSVGRLSKFFGLPVGIQGFDEEFQNILFHILSILLKIAVGLAYFLTSNHKSLPNIGKTNIVKTVTTIPITANLIVLIAGLILSSFHHDNIRSSHHQRIKTIEKIQETNTNHDIANNIKSQNSILGHNILVHELLNAFTTSTIIVYILLKKLI